MLPITGARIKLVEENKERLLAFCTITIAGCFVVRDLKLIGGHRGRFVSMPSRKATDRCGCGGKNHLRARYCGNCGLRLNEDRAPRDGNGKATLHFDIAHPISRECREAINSAVLAEYAAEMERAAVPGYVSTYDDWAEADLLGLYPRA